MMDHPWIKYYPPGVPESITYPRFPLYRFLEQSAARFPERDALIFYDGEAGRELSRKSYGKLDGETGRMAGALAALGVRPGDRVAYFMQNFPELVVSFYGILKAGAVAVPCNPMYQREELAHQLRDSGARLIICDAGLYPLVEQVIPETAVEQVVAVGEIPDNAGPGVPALDTLLSSHEAPSTLPKIDSEVGLALLPYTGGTTGAPKGTMLTPRNLVVDVCQFKDWFRYEEGKEVFIAALPLFHIGGIAGVMNVPLAVGATMLLFNRFHPLGVLRAVQEYRATRFLGVPTMYISILGRDEAAGFDLSSLRASRTSAAPLPVAVKEDFDRLVGHEVLIEDYGLTETSPLTHVNPPARAKAGEIGVPLPDTDAKIVDADTGVGDLPTGEVGELLVRGPQVMKGYWNQPEETALV